MSQKVMDSTQQAASSTRDRRASLVMEVSESEHESVSTRILANYNHMHALTIQYYEVIEIYRVMVDLTQVERCLFVPMKRGADERDHPTIPASAGRCGLHPARRAADVGVRGRGRCGTVGPRRPGEECSRVRHGRTA